MLKSRFNVLIAQREQQIGRRLTDMEIAEESKLSRPTIRKYRTPSPIERLDAEAIVKLCKWAECTVGDLLVLESDGMR